MARARARSVLGKMVRSGRAHGRGGGAGRERSHPLCRQPAPARAVGRRVCGRCRAGAPAVAGQLRRPRADRRDDHRRPPAASRPDDRARPDGRRGPQRRRQPGRAWPCSTCRAACACWWAAARTSTASSIAPLKAKRQPGSAFKPFVYLAALEGGMRPDSIVQDLPILGTGWSPRNEGGQYRGTVSLRDALALSMNAAAARLNMKVGPRRTAARRAPPRHPVRAARGRARSRWAHRR